MKAPTEIVERQQVSLDQLVSDYQNHVGTMNSARLKAALTLAEMKRRALKQP